MYSKVGAPAEDSRCVDVVAGQILVVGVDDDVGSIEKGAKLLQSLDN